MVVVLAAAFSGLVGVVAPLQLSRAVAADASGFQAGYLISDDNFFNSTSLSASDVQSFLNSRVSNCQPVYGMPCLRDYVAQSTPALPADAYCNAFPGGSMTAAQLIAAVSQACGISPKVILVMLQKEQSLITDPSPDARQYSAALGQGCPDGAACDPDYAGFFYQLYGAARQLQIYVKNPDWFGYQLGWNNILYQANPPDRNGACGTKRVYIQNDATRALYVYTPYTPNQAALDNLYGTGDFCSSYGNRNFWRLYTDWFGDPTADQVSGEYAAVWQSLGGASGVLGAPRGVVVCIDNRYCQQQFVGGTIFWFPSRGVFGVPAVVESMWRNLGFIDGKPGLPTGVPVCANDSTCAQSFDGGVIAADSIGGSLVGQHIQYTWLAAGGVSLGGARGPEVCATGGQCAQTFARAAFFSGGGATAVVGGVFQAWSAAGMSGGAMGYPQSDAVCANSGCTQQFAGGIIVAAGANAQAIPTALATPYLAAGGVAALGAPVKPAVCGLGVCSQLFERARIDISTSRGTIITTGAFLSAWAARGYDQGVLGAPTAAAACSAVTCSQSFQGGVLVGSPSNGVVAVMGQYRDVWLAAGGATGSLGLPLGNDSCDGKSCSQVFQRGVLAWTPTYGMVTVSGWFLQPWQAQGSGAGVLGAPTAAAACSAVTCSQSFQGGVLSGSPSNGVVAVSGEYRDLWMAAGGPTGTLGRVLAAAVCNGRWCEVDFDHGAIVWSPATGANAVSDPVYARWAAAGGPNGRYGLPLRAAKNASGGVVQDFQFGTITVAP